MQHLRQCKVQINIARHERREADLSSVRYEESIGIISKGVFSIKERMRNVLGRLHIPILGRHCERGSFLHTPSLYHKILSEYNRKDFLKKDLFFTLEADLYELDASLIYIASARPSKPT